MDVEVQVPVSAPLSIEPHHKPRKPQSLVQSFALWHGPPPLADITCILLSQDGTRLVIGDSSGLIVIWLVLDADGNWTNDSHNRAAALQPFIVITGVQMAVIHICECLSDEGAAVCSLYSDGTLVVYSLADGSCVHSYHQLVTHPATCVALEGLRHVLVASNGTALPVVHIPSNKVFCQLNSLSPVVYLPPSLCDITTDDESCKVFVSLSADNHLQYWDYEAIDPSLAPVKHEHFSLFNIQINVKDNQSICGCDQTAQCDIILIIFSDGCLLYMFRSKQPFLTLPAPPGVTYRSGRFANGTHVVLLAIDGSLHIYQLSPNAISVAREKHSSMSSSEKALHKAACAMIKMQSLPTSTIAEVEEDQDRGLAGMFSGLFRSAPKKKLSGPIGGGHRIPARAAAAVGLPPPMSHVPLDVPGHGSLPLQLGRSGSFDPYFKDITDPDLAGSWQDVERFAQSDDFLPDTTDVDQPLVYCETLTSSAALRYFVSASPEQSLLFAAANDHDLYLWANEDKAFVELVMGTNISKSWGQRDKYESNQPETDDVIGVSHFSPHHCFLVEGCTSGVVIVTPCCATSATRWQAHKSCVTAIFVDDKWLVTGASDGSVKVWEGQYFDLECEFLSHTHAVLHLLSTPETIRTRQHLHVCSIGADWAIVFYNLVTMTVDRVLDQHRGSVQQLRWVSDPDFALVTCSDAMVYAWDITCGKLLRKLAEEEGQEVAQTSGAKDVLHHARLSNNRGSRSRGSHSHHRHHPSQFLYGRACFADCEHTDNGCPEVPMVVIDVRALLTHIHEAAKVSFQHRGHSGHFPNSPLTVTQSFPDVTEMAEPSSPQGSPPSFHLDAHLAAALTLLFHPDHHPAIDELRNLFSLPRATHLPVSFVLRGSSSMAAIQCPTEAGPGLYGLSPIITASRSIMMLAILYAMAAFHPKVLKPICKECINYYMMHIPKASPYYRRPAFSWCAMWLADPSPDIKFAARCVMNASLKHRKGKGLQTLVASLTDAVQGAGDEFQLHANVAALAVLCLQANDKTDPETMTLTITSLIKVLDAGGHMHICALNLLAENYPIWKPYTSDVPALLSSLFDQTFSVHDEPNSPTTEPPTTVSDGHNPRLPTSTPSPPSHVPHDPELAKAASAALVAVAECHPRHFLDVLEETLGHARMHRQAQAVICITQLMKRSPVVLYPHLFRVIGLILKVLDPHMPALRDHCLPVSTVALRTAVLQFDMVVFQQVKQRLAVGDHGGQVIVYNMRTATKWTTWTAHERGIASMQFSPNGEYLATYCNAQACIKVWQYEGATVLGMPSSPKLVKMFPVPNNAPATVEQFFQRSGPTLTWTGTEIRLAGYTTVPHVAFSVNFGG